MPTRIRFVLNTLTGEVEEFLIDDQNRTLPEAEHDRIARDIGGLIARNPTVTVAPRDATRPAAASAAPTPEAEREAPAAPSAVPAAR